MKELESLLSAESRFTDTPTVPDTSRIANVMLARLKVNNTALTNNKCLTTRGAVGQCYTWLTRLLVPVAPMW